MTILPSGSASLMPRTGCFQMELQRRYGAGRLAEMFGEAAVPLDTQMRVLGLYRAAEAAFPQTVARGAQRDRGL
jgi:penicillin amidase